MAIETGVNSGNLQVMPTAMRMPTLNYGVLDLGDMTGKIAKGVALGRDLVEHKKNRENELALKKAQIEAAQALAKQQQVQAEKVSATVESEKAATIADNTLDAASKTQKLQILESTDKQAKATALANANVAEQLSVAKEKLVPTEIDTAAVKAGTENVQAKGVAKRLPVTESIEDLGAESQRKIVADINEKGFSEAPGGKYVSGPKGPTFVADKNVQDEFISTESVPAVDTEGKPTGRTDVYGITQGGQRKLIPTLSKTSGGTGMRPAIPVNPITGNPLTKTEQTRDDRLATKLGDWDAAGGYPAVETRISQAEKSLSDLEEIYRSEEKNVPTGIVGKVKAIPGAFTSPTGVVSSATGKALGAFTGSDLSNISDQKARLAINQLQSAARETIKELMGAQFTQKEGDAVIAAVFPRDASLYVAMESARQFLARIKSTAAHRKSMLDYEQEHGTYAGYNGTAYIGDENTTAKDFLNGIGFTGAGAQGAETQSDKGSGQTKVVVKAGGGYSRQGTDVPAKGTSAKPLSTTYKSSDDVKAAYQRGDISREDAIRIGKEMGVIDE